MAASNALAKINETEMPFRVAPHNVEAEQALLGAILVNNDAYYRVSDFLEPSHFHEETHRRIYDICQSLIRAGKLATPITLKTFVGDQDLGGITISQYLGRLAAEATTIINAEAYGRTIYELAMRRQLVLIGEEIVNTAYDAAADDHPKQQIEAAEKRLYELAENGRFDGGFVSFSSALRIAVDLAAEAFKRDRKLSGIATGMSDLDRIMGGLQSSDLVIIAGRPGMGKTALATNMAFNIARAYRSEKLPDGTTKRMDGGVVGFFSLEMSSEQLATRIIAEQSGVPSYKIRRGEIQDNDFDRIVDAAREMERIPFYIDQTGGISIAQLATRARRLKRQKGLDILVVDYLQLLSGSSKKGENRVQDHHRPQSPRQGTRRSRHCPLAALASGRTTRRQTPATVRSSRIGVHRAGRRRRHVRIPRGILPEKQRAPRRHRRTSELANRDGPDPWPRRNHHRQATPRTDRHRHPAI